MTRIHPSERGDATTHALAREKQEEGEAKHVDAEHEVDPDSGMCWRCDIENLDYLNYRWAVPDEQSVNSSPRGGSHDQEQQEIRMIGDFDSGATALWTLYRDEAKSHDEARIRSLKEDMDGVLIFVRSCSVYSCNRLTGTDAHPHRLVYTLLLSPRS